MAVLDCGQPLSFGSPIPGLSLASLKASAYIARWLEVSCCLTVSVARDPTQGCMTERNLGSTKQFVPSGVDAQSWIGFEQRIQERRFKALVETITGAVARRDGIVARAALEEARELRPHAPELDRLAARVAMLPTSITSAASSAYLWHRGLGAVAMFVVGVGLVIGIEQVRPGPRSGAPASVVAPASASPGADSSSPAFDAATSVLASNPAPVSSAVVTQLPVKTPDIAEDPVVAAPLAPEAVVEAKREEPVGTSGVSSASTVDARPADVPNRTTFRAAVEAASNSGGRPPEQVVQASREVPEDHVAASPRSENRQGFTEVAAPGPAVAANVMPQPVSVTVPALSAPPPPLPATTAGAAGSAITLRADDSRVAQVLNQYARAYDRLDPGAARAVWPTVDERALSRAFASLESQDVSFDRCDIDVKGNLASASCRGTASYVGKIGSRQARTEARQWNFELKLHGDDWKIEKAQTVAR